MAMEGHGDECPNFDRLEAVLRNEETPGRVPFIEIGIDREIMEAILGRAVPDPSRENWSDYHSYLVDFFGGLGYDYVLMGVRCHQEDAHLESRTTEDTALLSRGIRSWAPMDGVVKTWKDYDGFPWADPRRPETDEVKALGEVLPEGMKVIAVSLCVMEPLAERIMGVKALSKNLYGDPELVRDVCARLGEPAVAASRAAAKLDEVGAVAVCDDLGYRSGTLISPHHLKEYVLPWHRRLVEAVHEAGKPAILHSCGNLQAVMDDVIDYCGYDAKHAFEDVHTPVTYAKEKWGERISLLGGIDMDCLARKSTEDLRAYVRHVLRKCAGSGYALGAGNSVSNYVPVQNYLAMLDEGRSFLA